MSYKYEPTVAERKAAALLRDKGWRVSEPACPLCHGWGSIPRYQTWRLDEAIGQPSMWSGTLAQDQCPNGCTLGVSYFPETTATVVLP